MKAREVINNTLSKRSVHWAKVNSLLADIESLDKEIEDNEKQKSIARKAAKLVQDNLASKLSGIVSRALSTVFEEDIKFVVNFVERRGVSECDLFLRIGDYDYDILNEHGGGVADVCSLCLQMAFIMMSDVNRVLIIDEPARHMNEVSEERFICVLRELCKELNFTVIMVTHSQAFVDGADRVFKVTKKGEDSYVSYS